MRHRGVEGWQCPRTCPLLLIGNKGSAALSPGKLHRRGAAKGEDEEGWPEPGRIRRGGKLGQV